jgi:hypothetical protein
MASRRSRIVPDMLEFDHLCRRAAVNGLAVRGAFRPEQGEFGAALGQAAQPCHQADRYAGATSPAAL